MTRRRFYAPPAVFDFDKGTVTLTAEEARHARDVLRLRAGDEIYLFDGQGKEFRGILRGFARAGAAVDALEEVEPARPESPLQLTLGISLLKGEKFDLVIQKATELGVSRIVPILTERADVRPKAAAEAHNRISRWQRIALEAAKQSGRARSPQIDAPVVTNVWLNSGDFDGATKLFFSERQGRALRDSSPTNNPTHVTAAVGPEGGWSDEEIAQARKTNWEVVTLGGRTMRAETAAIAIVALLQHRFGDLK